MNNVTYSIEFVELIELVPNQMEVTTVTMWIVEYLY